MTNDQIRRIGLLMERQAIRLINPPLIQRTRCRICGAAIQADDQNLCLREQDLYAHRACVDRER